MQITPLEMSVVADGRSIHRLATGPFVGRLVRSAGADHKPEQRHRERELRPSRDRADGREKETKSEITREREGEETG